MIHPREHDLVIGTFGRAAWVLDDIRPLRAMAKNTSVMSSNITLFNPPTAYQAAYQQPTGSRFGADAMFHGENRSGGARFAYIFNKKDQPKTDKKEDQSEKDASKVKWDSLTLKLYDGSRLIRTLKRKAPKENGLQRWTWFMDESGVDRPSRRIRKSTREPGGVSVKPGTYKAVLHYGDQTSETIITVASDPRLNVSQKNINEVYAAGKELENISQTLADASKQLIESKGIASKYKSELKKLDKEAYKNQIKASDSVVKSIDSLLDKYFGKIDKRQGITRNPEVTALQRLRTASGYIYGSQTGLTTTETTLMKHAKDAVKELISETNAFFNNQWKSYETDMKTLQINPFEETKIFKID